MSITKEFIKQNLLDKSGKISSQKIRNHNVHATVEQLYQIWHEMSGPTKCAECDNPTKFKNFTAGYLTYCSTKCSAQSADTAAKKAATNLERYGHVHPSQCALTKKKTEQTNLLRYGVEHALQLPKYQDKRKATFVERYGVEYPTQSEDVQNKIKQTNLARYGVERPTQLDSLNQKSKDQRRAIWLPHKLDKLSHIVIPLFSSNEYTDVDQKYKWQCTECATEFESRLSDGRIPRCPTCFPYGYRSSKLEAEVAEFIQSLGFDIIANSRAIIPPLELDIIVPRVKVAIEINGEYWHAELQGRNKNYHLAKSDVCKQVGYRLAQIFTAEWVLRPELVRSRIKSLLGVNQKIPARKCKVVTLSRLDASTFLDANHMQKSCPSKVNLGLEYCGKLVAVMTFGKSRYNKAIEWELIRYASTIDTNIVGGASKLLSYFVRQHSPTSLISYCDLRWNTGGLYAALGFTHSHDSPPNYWYTKDYRNLESRVKYQKHKLKNLLVDFDPTKTEWENMQSNGYDRIWDCGNSVWKLVF